MKKYKKKLPLLYIAAALEKFSFNGISAMLVLYMTGYLSLNDGTTFEIFGATMALGFVSPLIGGWLADHVLNNRNALLLGAALMAIGLYILMIKSVPIFYLGLGLSVLGSGFIRSNIPDLLGKICIATNKSKDSSFTWLYVAFNVGSLLGAIGCGVLGEIFGWHISFLIAGTAMLLFIFLILSDGKNYTQCKINSVPFSERLSFISIQLATVIISIILAVIIGFVIYYNYILDYFLPTLIVLGSFLIIDMTRKYQVGSFSSIMILILFMLFQAVFFALYNQENMSLILFAKRNVDHSLIGLIGIRQISLLGYVFDKIPTTFFQTIDPIWNIILGSLLAVIWKNLEKNNINIGAFNKFSIGIITTSIGFGLLALRSQYGNSISLSPWWLIGAYALFVTGELCIIPVGFSLVSNIAPKKYSAIFMGIWFLSFAFSMWLAGQLSKLFANLNVSGVNSEESLNTYIHAFKCYSLFGVIMLILIIILSPFFKMIKTEGLSYESQKIG